MMTSVKTYICPECGRKMFVPRRKSRLRGEGHIKDLYCPGCRKTQKFAERSEYIPFANE